MLMDRKIGFVFFLMAYPLHLLISQEVDMRKRLVLDKFPTEESVLWTRYYRGFLDHRFAVDILLASDGMQVHGAMRIEMDDHFYYLDGEQRGDLLLLEETDEEGTELAFITGYFDGRAFNGHWKNNRGDVRFDLQFYEYKYFSKLMRAMPRLSSFKTKNEPLKGYWSVYDDGFTVLLGTFITDQGTLFQIRGNRLQGSDEWSVNVFNREQELIFNLRLDLKSKMAKLPAGHPQNIPLKGFKNYPIFEFHHESTYTFFINQLKVSKEHKRLKVFGEKFFFPGDIDQKVMENQAFRGYTLLMDFFYPVYLSEDWVVGFWVQSDYQWEGGLKYQDLLVHYYLKNRTIRPFDIEWSEEGKGPVLQALVQNRLERFEKQYRDIIKTLPAQSKQIRWVYTPIGHFAAFDYNEMHGLLLIPIEDDALDQHVHQSNKNKTGSWSLKTLLKKPK